MEEVESWSVHKHSLIPFTRFVFSQCMGCYPGNGPFHGHFPSYIYGGYRCNELGCESVVFHKECAKPFPEINHSSHPDHPLKLFNSFLDSCTLCGGLILVGYRCSICDFKLHLLCARKITPLVLPENSNRHEHPLQLFLGRQSHSLPQLTMCKVCDFPVVNTAYRAECRYTCIQCESIFHAECAKFFPEAYHTSHPRHPLKFLKLEEAPDYADNKCLLCGSEFDERLHHCDVCNFSICKGCMGNPPPLVVVSTTTHEHQLHLVPRRINFICNACGTLGDRSPYFCLECNFMIHRECIDLPRIIYINRHDHRISYTRRLGHGEWKCRVCRKNMDGFYGAYSCSRCPSFAVHSRCATSRDVWDMIEREGTPEEVEVEPFEVIDENTIKHFTHDHNLKINKDGHILHESTLCEACVLQISSEPFYSCEQCNFILHEKCANLPRRKRHVCHNQPFTLLTDSHRKVYWCDICLTQFSGFRYQSDSIADSVLDVRCGSLSEPFLHGSHLHYLYYDNGAPPLHYGERLYSKRCTRCGEDGRLSCDECEYSLCFVCAMLPQKVMRHRYDDHPLFLSYGISSVDGKYWCEACETEVNPMKWVYMCNDCGVVLHVSCVVGDYTYVMPITSSVLTSYDEVCIVIISGEESEEVDSINSSGEEEAEEMDSVPSSGKEENSVTRLREGVEEVVSNTSICRPLCCVCNTRCKLPFVLKSSRTGVELYNCSLECRNQWQHYLRMKSVC